MDTKKDDMTIEERGIQNLDDVENGSEGKRTFHEDLRNLLEKATRFLHKLSQVGLDELADLYSDSIDEYIIMRCQQSQLTYVGGHFVIIYANEKYFKISIELYFQNLAKEWVKVTSAPIVEKTEQLKPDDLETLKTDHKVTYNIDAPQVKG